MMRKRGRGIGGCEREGERECVREEERKEERECESKKGKGKRSV